MSSRVQQHWPLAGLLFPELHGPIEYYSSVGSLHACMNLEGINALLARANRSARFIASAYSSFFSPNNMFGRTALEMALAINS